MPSKKSYSKSYYKKRPLWQWIVIYLIIGGIAYALIYYFVFARNRMVTSPSSSSGSPSFSLPRY